MSCCSLHLILTLLSLYSFNNPVKMTGNSKKRKAVDSNTTKGDKQPKPSKTDGNIAHLGMCLCGT
jgi:hypothetical protein